MTTRPGPAVVALRKREIAQRYRGKRKKAGQKNRPLSFAAIRAAELTRLFDYRYGNVILPNDSDGLVAAIIMAHHIARLRDAPRRISDWLATCTPWLDLASRERLITDATECPLRWRADRLAWKLGVTAQERDDLDLRTIGAIDMTPEQRQAVVKERKRARDRQRSTKPRADYEAASLARTKPWLDAGMSRAKWYRDGKPRP